MEWDKIWAMNKKVIDPIAPRFTTVDRTYHVPINIKDVQSESVKADKHPKNPEIGQKIVWRGRYRYLFIFYNLCGICVSKQPIR